VVSLAGDWAFRLDPADVGRREEWPRTALPDRIRLPGSTDEQGYGARTIGATVGKLTRVYSYVGPAWFQRRVDVPAQWAGRVITLTLERCHWETEVYVDGRLAGPPLNSLCAAQVHDLSRALTPGSHTLTIRVDNTLKIDIGQWGHSVTDETQTNWNGIVGRIELAAASPLGVDQVAVFPDVTKKQALVRAALRNATGSPASVTVEASVAPRGSAAAPSSATPTAHVRLDGSAGVAEFDLPMDGAELWDEFKPALYEATVVVRDAGGAEVDARTTAFGMRELGKRGTQLTVNARPIFLRGTLECCIFPLTGYPPTDKESWLRILRIAKSYGLNHLRFHSWCPPEAAFEAADEMGFLYQVEGPLWVGDRVDADPKRAAFYEEEVGRILRAYGSHPSFGLYSMGNELLLGGADSSWLQALLDRCRRDDPRRLYTCSSAPYDGRRNDDYFVSHAGADGTPLRGPGWLNSEVPGTTNDYRAAIAGSDRPIIAHELGQWAMYADLDEPALYTGALQARNFGVYRQSLEEHGMLNQARAFLDASGRFSVLLYRAEIERALRTPGLAGFQLLDVHDFPGQGTALVGMLNPFWKSKGLVTPEEFREYCAPVVPLARLARMVWTSGETLEATVDLANYGPGGVLAATAVWSLEDSSGIELARGSVGPPDAPTGGLTALGGIYLPLANCPAPAKLTLRLSMPGLDARNHYDVWVYPDHVPTSPGEGVTIADELDANALDSLAKGGKVLIRVNPEWGTGEIQGSFTPVFWCTRLFPGQPGTMGILCDPGHPAFARFPTESHADWQWWDLMNRSAPLVLDDTPPDYRPLVQVIDNFDRNHKLGIVFEARVGKGRLLVTSIDLATDLESRPEARQLLHSLLSYMGSTEFQPRWELPVSVLSRVIPSRPVTLEGAAAPDADALAGAVLRVRAGANVPSMTSPPWRPEHDSVMARRDGFAYSVNGGSWLDATSSAWHGHDLEVTVTCPPRFTGTLYTFFHDWNAQGRSARVTWNGSPLGMLRDHSRGFWLAVRVTAADSASGRLTLAAHTLWGPNIMMSELILVPR
jgi:hypothetical protein